MEERYSVNKDARVELLEATINSMKGELQLVHDFLRLYFPEYTQIMMHAKNQQNQQQRIPQYSSYSLGTRSPIAVAPPFVGPAPTPVTRYTNGFGDSPNTFDNRSLWTKVPNVGPSGNSHRLFVPISPNIGTSHRKNGIAKRLQTMQNSTSPVQKRRGRKRKLTPPTVTVNEVISAAAAATLKKMNPTVIVDENREIQVGGLVPQEYLNVGISSSLNQEAEKAEMRRSNCEIFENNGCNKTVPEETPALEMATVKTSSADSNNIDLSAVANTLMGEDTTLSCLELLAAVSSAIQSQSKADSDPDVLKRNNYNSDTAFECNNENGDNSKCDTVIVQNDNGLGSIVNLEASMQNQLKSEVSYKQPSHSNLLMNSDACFNNEDSTRRCNEHPEFQQPQLQQFQASAPVSATSAISPNISQEDLNRILVNPPEAEYVI